MKRAILLGLVLFMGGCGVPTAVIKAQQAEVEFLKMDEETVGQKYADRRAVLEASIADLWAACAADIVDYEPTPEKPLDAYAVECITGVRAAETVLREQMRALDGAENQERENFATRRRLLTRATEIVEASQQWPEDAKEWAKELRLMLEEEDN